MVSICCQAALQPTATLNIPTLPGALFNPLSENGRSIELQTNQDVAALHINLHSEQGGKLVYTITFIPVLICTSNVLKNESWLNL